jgi:hypothetical protein
VTDKIIVKESTLKSEPGKELMVGLLLACGSCGAENYVNVVSQAHARQLAEWCPTCEEEQDPAAAMSDFHVGMLPEEDPAS